MSSTLVLLALLISLSIAVVFPELQFSRNSKVKISSEYEIMVNKQRKGFSVLGLLALVSFFIALQALSVPIFIFHLITDVIFALYAYLSSKLGLQQYKMQIYQLLTRLITLKRTILSY